MIKLFDLRSSLWRFFLGVLLTCLFVTGHGGARAATLTGHIVSTDGNALPGAMVSLTAADQSSRLTVYADQQGRFTLSTEMQGRIGLRVRARYHEDYLREADLKAETELDLRVFLRPLQTPEALSDSLTASAHAKKLKWHDAYRRETFISQCHYCHQMGNELTRQPRDEEEWADVISRMEGYFTLVTPWDKSAMKKTLARDFDGKPVKRLDDGLATNIDEGHDRIRATAKLREWQVGDAMSFIHDTEVGSDGRLYGVDQGHDVVWELDRATGKVTRHQMPDSPLPEGGLYSGAQLPIGIFTGKHGPHSLAEDERGRFWITGSLSSTLLSFDIKTKKFEVFEIGSDALYPHTIRRDREGVFWFTLPASNQVGRFDPKTRKFTLIELPSNGFFRWLTDALFPTVLKVASWFPKKNTHLWMSHHWWTGLGRKILNFPYGIDIHPRNR